MSQSAQSGGQHPLPRGCASLICAVRSRPPVDLRSEICLESGITHEVKKHIQLVADHRVSPAERHKRVFELSGRAWKSATFRPDSIVPHIAIR
jgi:hypothetical protein